MLARRRSAASETSSAWVSCCAGTPHPDGVDLRAEPLPGAKGSAQDALRPRLRRDEHQDPLGHRLVAQRIEHRGRPPRLDVFGELTQNELTEGGQVLEPEEVLERRVDPRLRVDLAVAQPLLERFGREIDEQDLVGLVEDPVGEGLPHAHSGHVEDLVVEALEVLDVDRRGDCDARREDLVDVLVPLAVTRLGKVRVGELVDERELGAAGRSRRRDPSRRARRPRRRSEGAGSPRGPRRARPSRAGREARGSRGRRRPPRAAPGVPPGASDRSSRLRPPFRPRSCDALSHARVTPRRRCGRGGRSA